MNVDSIAHYLGGKLSLSPEIETELNKILPTPLVKSQWELKRS